MTEILVIDDDRDMREILELTLEGLGYSVATAADGNEALDWLEHHELPRLVFLDWMMPGCDGSEFRRRQLEDARLANLPVVLITADLRFEKKRAALGVTDSLEKPISLSRLRELAQRYLNGTRRAS